MKSGSKCVQPEVPPVACSIFDSGPRDTSDTTAGVGELSHSMQLGGPAAGLPGKGSPGMPNTRACITGPLRRFNGGVFAASLDGRVLFSWKSAHAARPRSNRRHSPSGRHSSLNRHPVPPKSRRLPFTLQPPSVIDLFAIRGVHVMGFRGRLFFFRGRPSGGPSWVPWLTRRAGGYGEQAHPVFLSRPTPTAPTAFASTAPPPRHGRRSAPLMSARSPSRPRPRPRPWTPSTRSSPGSPSGSARTRPRASRSSS